ncbi:hypothetical protein [Luteibacter yeojuensis]|uniref:Uncharacterized protein n=1 Tax=Luteibacter yeojuensis TaxID=345309 RepID=A0A7X5QTF6_9GAMM|nr:hypothetical protein [Luteibacter yeojuensis]NID14985.1 hypothetical protein [Luteibacter yeojuensis]
MTHADLVERAGAWLRGAAGCKIVMTELAAVCRSGEIPDAIGWREGGTILVEAKTSRADFLADRKKPFRREPERGMGTLRFFLAPAEMIRPNELPPRWGLLEVRGRRVFRVVGPDPRSWSGAWGEFRHAERAHDCETAMLLSGMNRLRISLGDAEFRRLVHLRLMDRDAEVQAAREVAA